MLCYICLVQFPESMGLEEQKNIKESKHISNCGIRYLNIHSWKGKETGSLSLPLFWMRQFPHIRHCCTEVLYNFIVMRLIPSQSRAVYKRIIENPSKKTHKVCVNLGASESNDENQYLKSRRLTIRVHAVCNSIGCGGTNRTAAIQAWPD